MNDNLKNYSEKPGPEVWDSLSRTLRRSVLRRQLLGGASALALLAAAVLVVELSLSKREAAQPAAPAVAAARPVDASPATVAAAPAAVAAAPSSAASAPAASAPAASPQPVAGAPKAAPNPMASLQPAPSVPVAAPAAPFRPAPAAAPAPHTETVPPLAAAASEPQTKGVESAAQATEPKSPVITNIKDTILWVPNIIAPNSDDENIRQFLPKFSSEAGSITNYSLSIFNRGGQRVFASTEVGTGWDGSFNGRNLPQAAYIYIIYYTDKDGLRHQRKGTVTLVR